MDSQPLPDQVVDTQSADPNKVKIIELQSPLEQLIKTKIKLLQSNQTTLQNKQVEHTELRKKTISEWQEKTLSEHSIHISEQQNLLANLQRQFMELPKRVAITCRDISTGHPTPK